MQTRTDNEPFVDQILRTFQDILQETVLSNRVF